MFGRRITGLRSNSDSAQQGYEFKVYGAEISPNGSTEIEPPKSTNTSSLIWVSEPPGKNRKVFAEVFVAADAPHFSE